MCTLVKLLWECLDATLKQYDSTTCIKIITYKNVLYSFVQRLIDCVSLIYLYHVLLYFLLDENSNQNQQHNFCREFHIQKLPPPSIQYYRKFNIKILQRIPKCFEYFLLEKVIFKPLQKLKP